MKLIKKVKNPSFLTFKMLLSQEDIQTLLKMLFYEIGLLRKLYQQDRATHSMIQDYQIEKRLLVKYTVPKKKERSMYIHNMEQLDLLLRMMEKHIYKDACSDSYVKLYNRLCTIYKKRSKEWHVLLENLY